MISFSKFESTGNDFILADNRRRSFPVGEERIRRLCHRRFGIGADGLILIETHPVYDFTMRYFNSDGREATFCGNGGRAVCGFARSLGIQKEKYRFQAVDGVHEAFVEDIAEGQWFVSLGMCDVVVEDPSLIHTGSPHHLLYVEDLKHFDVKNRGAELRHDPQFAPDGCNVNFLEFIDGKLWVRTFERGVEEETLSCGTGVTAASVFHAIAKPDGDFDLGITTSGGSLKVSFHKHGHHFSQIVLSGPTRKVFDGKLIPDQYD